MWKRETYFQLLLSFLYIKGRHHANNTFTQERDQFDIDFLDHLAVYYVGNRCLESLNWWNELLFYGLIRFFK